MLETRRLRFREFRVDDFDAVHSYASDPLVTRLMSWGPNSEDETRAFLATTIAEATEDPRQNYTFALTLKDSGGVIGSGGVYGAARPGATLIFGYCLHRDYWGQGLGGEAAAALVDLGFSQLGARRVVAHVFAGNDASARLLQRLHFVETRFDELAICARDTWFNVSTFELDEHTWRQPLQ
ncbi:MAG: GNAT family N-acetyltransferase [Gemmatimonadaceae bacterium]